MIKNMNLLASILALAACGLATLTLSACAEVSDAPIEPQSELAVMQQAAGQPAEGYPNYNERVVLYLTNRARTEPTAFSPEGAYPPSAPLRHDLALAKAARWQAAHIINDGCWCADHSSCCVVERVDGEVQCVGGNTGCGATSVGERVALWSTQYSGENAAMGYPTSPSAIDGWISSSGHWQNMNSSTHTLLGAGQHQSGWVQVFGRSSQLRPVAEDGIHFGSGSSTTFASTYYQPGTGGPRHAMVVVNGVCRDLSLAYGQADHGAFEVTVALEPGCNRYYFHFTDGNGAEHTYPSTGSLGVQQGGAGNDCPLYLATRPADTCSPSGQPCETGHTRPCYTGPFGTQGVGICKAGSERCRAAQWDGECNHEVHPEPVDICGTGLDENCNGEVDETCPPPPDEDDQDVGLGQDASIDDAGPHEGRRPRKRDDDGCAAVASSPLRSSGAWVITLLGLLMLARRRRRALNKFLVDLHRVV